MKNIQIENLRSLKKTNTVPISPITILVGENSSGKSTFLRVFPLLKQSFQKKTNGPILWAGDVDDYVDFGSFDDAVTNDGADNIEIKFSFDLQLNTFVRRYFWQLPINERKGSTISVDYSVRIEKNDEKEYVSILDVGLNSTRIRMTGLNRRQPTIFVDDAKISYLEAKNADKSEENYYLWGKFIGHSIFGIQMPQIITWVISSFNELFTKSDALNKELSTGIESFYAIGEYLIGGYSVQKIIAEINKSRKTSGSRSILNKSIMNDVLKQIEVMKDEDQRLVIQKMKLLYFYLIYSDLEEFIGTYFSQVHYIAPIRATAERYYRLRNSAIDEVDYQGKNLAIFLNSLPRERLEQFQEWTDKHFGFRASVNHIQGHLSIEIARKEYGEKINLSDTGFGYSQLLPVITQLWELSSRKSKSKDTIQKIPIVIAIEQPELHLHPAMQARLAKAFIACIDLARENGRSLQIILETHSETIINWLGRAIAQGTLAPTDVSVVLFDRDEESKYSNITISNYDTDGFLEYWPVGFFAPED